MKPLKLHGRIARRLLVNYRADPATVARLLPPPFRPHLVGGSAVAGICLIRLDQLRPRGFPGFVGLTSESAAHRIAVEWDTADGIGTGVYIPRRDTDSLVNVLVGGRLFPGEHHRARVHTEEAENAIRVSFESHDRSASIDVSVNTTRELGGQLFRDIDEASRFFESGSIGYSATSGFDRFDGLELQTNAWRVEPVRVTDIRSSFFEDPERFPAGTATLDCALLMRDIPVRWQALEPLVVSARAGNERLSTAIRAKAQPLPTRRGA